MKTFPNLAALALFLSLISDQLSPARAQSYYVCNQSGAYNVLKFDASGNESIFVP